MRGAVLNRYLGNKTELLDAIMEVAGRYCPPGAKVCDIFSGTLSVALEFKRRGYAVIANDINPFSEVIGDALLVNNEVPPVEWDVLLPHVDPAPFRRQANAATVDLAGNPGFSLLRQEPQRARYAELLSLVAYLEQLRPEAVPQEWRRSDIFDTYTEGGANSAFVSRRGQSGRRRYFSDANGRHIDAVLSQIRAWWRQDLLSPSLYAVLTCGLLRAVEKVSNTQGTYHDFPREYIDPRAFGRLVFDPLPLDTISSGGDHLVGRSEDSLEFIKRAPEHDLIYIDPPYNFRQYTSYYFLPNLLARYARIDDLDEYFANVRYVRGQNMEDDFVSPFCRKAEFLNALGTLIQDARSRYVLLSYFDGRNHWNDFKSEANGVGYEKLKDFFSSNLFKPGSMTVVPVSRTNYQSYGGYKARGVVEFLFVAEKAGS